MNKFKFSYLLLGASFFILTNLNINAQADKTLHWTEMGNNKGYSFYDVQANFNDYWQGKIIKKGSGHKPFKRWESFMEPRVYPTGNMTLPYTNYANFITWQNKNYLNKLNKFKVANWTPIGPVGKPSTPVGGESRTGTGRVNFIRIDPTNTQKIFIGTPDGGMWRSTNGGASWNTNTDFLGVIGCSDLVIDPVNTQIMYLATGDKEGDRRSIGILKSIDGGDTWSPTSLAWKVQAGWKITRLIMDPNNALNMIISTNDGTYKTTDGWATFTAGNFPFGSPILNDIEFKPNDPNIVYASGSKLFKSTDFGINWKEITDGLPSTNISRIALGVSPANSNYVYALYGKASDQSFLGLFLSTDSGTTFSSKYTGPLNLLGYRVDGLDQNTGQAFYDLAIAVNPSNVDNVTVATINQWQTFDGGLSWNIISHWVGNNFKPTVHADFHDVTYEPGSSSVFYSGNDGGVYKTTDNGTTWTDLSNNVNISQINKLGISQSDVNKINAGMQDNGTNLKINGVWNNVFGGDGGESIIDYSNNNTIYFCYVYSAIYRSDDEGVSNKKIVNGLPHGAGTANFYSSFHQDPIVPTTLYAGGHPEIYRTTDRGDNWTMLGTPQGGHNIIEFAIAPSNNQIIYVVKRNAVSKSIDGGVTFDDITANLPVKKALPVMISVSNMDPLKVWVVFSGYSDGNKVFKSIDGGVTWTNISMGLPNLPINTIVSVNGSASDAIYIGADIGVYYLDNTKSVFMPFFTKLPNVSVRDLEIYYPTQKIRAATYGRGVWESDTYTKTLGINENLDIDNFVEVYPNPFSKELTIILKNNSLNLNYEIINSNGRMLKSGKIKDKLTIETSNFTSGVYILKIGDKKSFHIKKIIKL